jgi:hypothetical protein
MGRSKLPKGKGTSILYQDKFYELDLTEYTRLEDRLAVLDSLPDSEREAGFEWIVYNFLTEYDYFVDPPTSKEPIYGIDIEADGFTVNKIRNNPFMPTEEVRDKLAARREYKKPLDDDDAFIRPIRGRQPKREYYGGGSFTPIGAIASRNAKAADAGGTIALIILFLIGVGAMNNFLNNAPYPKDGKLVGHRDGNIIYEYTPTPTPYVKKTSAESSEPSSETGQVTVRVVPKASVKPSPLPDSQPSKKLERQLYPAPLFPQSPSKPLEEPRSPSSKPLPAPSPRRWVIPKEKFLEADRKVVPPTD